MADLFSISLGIDLAMGVLNFLNEFVSRRHNIENTKLINLWKDIKARLTAGDAVKLDAINRGMTMLGLALNNIDPRLLAKAKNAYNKLLQEQSKINKLSSKINLVDQQIDEMAMANEAANINTKYDTPATSRAQTAVGTLLAGGSLDDAANAASKVGTTKYDSTGFNAYSDYHKGASKVNIDQVVETAGKV